MLASVNKFVSWSAVLALLAFLPAASSAREEEQAKERQAGEDRWVPSLAVTSGITIQSQEASVALLSSLSGLDEDFSTDGDDLAVSPYVGANLELMSPALPLPGRPRVFLGAEILPTFAATRDVAKIGNPSGFEVRLEIDPNPPSPVIPGKTLDYALAGYPENTILGVGSATSAEIDSLVFGAGVGVAFPFEVRGRPLRLKPSIGWIRYKIDVEGRALKAECPPYQFGTVTTTACIAYDPGGPFLPPPAVDGFTREIVLGAQGSQSFNGIGGGLDIEMDVFRVGQLGVSLFLGGRFYWTLGDRTIELGKSVPFDREEMLRPVSVDEYPDAPYYPPPEDYPVPPGGYQFGTNVALPEETFTANWSFEVDPWMYRVGLGLRFHWLGSRK